MSNGYLWLKALHIVFVVTWFAGLFYLPRLFVYHTGTLQAGERDETGSARFKVMERKLYHAIMQPSMMLSLIFGTWLLYLGWAGFASSVWIWVKLLLVVTLLGYHHYCGRLIKAFARDANVHSEKFFRWFNELPALILITVVIMVVVKPF